ncbi:inner membrane protein OXA1-like [Euphorbia peplus]|nr:inner membrane protein OXA1-like [Euphorbia peplus]
MAYIRSLSTRSNLLSRRCHPSIGHVLHRDDSDTKHDSIHKETSNLLHHRGFGTTGFTNSSLIDRRYFDFSFSPSIGASFSRQMSTSIGDRTTTDTIEMMTDVVEVLSDTTLQSVAAPAVNEVAIAAADSFFPVAQVQHFIDAVHSFSGFNWWASIVLATLLVEGAIVPLKLYYVKAGLRFKLITPLLKEIEQKIQDGGLHMYDGNKQKEMLFKKYNVTRFIPEQWRFIPVPVLLCFFFAISNMAEKVPSFKTGGAYWFLDLSTPDTLYIFPVLTALTFCINLELNGPELYKDLNGLSIGTMKIISRGVAFLTVPLTMGLPKAIFCFWLTSYAIRLGFVLAIREPMVQKYLGLPEMCRRIRSELQASKENEQRISTGHNEEEDKQK